MRVIKKKIVEYAYLLTENLKTPQNMAIISKTLFS